MHQWLLLALYVLLNSAKMTFASNGVSLTHQASYAAVPEVAIAAAGPSIIGADGPELTQVEAAQQQLGLTGRGVTLCVIDTGCDTTSSSFGEGCPHNDASSCRVAFGYDTESDSDNPAPHAGSPLALHGQHVANIALGGFPDRLVDAAGKELPQQRGVAPGARLGAIRAATSSMTFPSDLQLRALRKSVSKRCDINNLSVGGFHVLPNAAIRPGMRAAAAAGILTTAAAGNDDQAPVWGPRLFNIASPAAFSSAFAVAHVAGSASPGAVLELDRPVMAHAGPTTTLTAIQRADTPASLCHANPAAPCHTSANASTSSTQPAFPLDLHLMQLLNTAAADSQPPSAPTYRPPPPRCTLFRASDTSVVAGQVLVMQFDNDCKAFASDEEVWELLVGLQPALVLLVLPTDGDATSTILYDRNKGLPVLWLQADAGAALVATLAAARQLAPVGIAVAGVPPMGAAAPPVDAGRSLGSASSRRSGNRAAGKEQAAAAAPKLLRWPSAALAPFPAAVAGQPAETSCLGPAFDLAIKPDIAAPGLAYSGLPGEGFYQVWPGTSQASPYIAGVLALWKEHMLNNRHTWGSGNASHDEAGTVERAGGDSGSSDEPARARCRRLSREAAAADGEGASEPERAAAPSRIRRVRHRATAAAAAAGGSGDAPPGGWLAAAFTAIKNTARPIPVPRSSRLYWPPAKVGAGIVQAHAAVLTRVSISPFELLLRTDRPSQSQSHWLTVTNAGSKDVTYVLQHKPAVTISLMKAWYGRALDGGAATAQVAWSEGRVTVPARSSVRVQVTLSIPEELQATDAFISGFISFVPAAASDDDDDGGDASTLSGGANALLSSSRQQPLSLHSPITLSVPYQGATKDYSSLGSNSSLVLFATVLPQLDASAAGVLARYPEIYVCESPSEAGCSYNKRDEPIISVTRTGANTSMAVRFGAALLRPVKDVVVQVWSGDGVLLGRSGSLGPAASAAPMKRSFLTEDPWDGRFTPANATGGGGDAGSSSRALRLQPGHAYQLRLELWPVLAVGDRLAGRKQQPPFVYIVRGVVRVVGE